MRILHIGKYFAPYHGGMETVLQNQAEGLLKAGHEVRILVADQHSLDTQVPQECVSTGQEMVVIKAGNWGLLQSQPLTLNLFSLLRKQLAEFQPDLVQIHLPNPLAVVVWQLLGKTTPMPRLALWHHADITRQRLGGWLLKPLMGSCRQQAKGIAVSSRALLENSCELGAFKNKVQVIPFGISDPHPSLVPSIPGVSFLFVGRLVPYKGLEVLLDAMAKVPGGQLDIVGQGPLRNHLARRIEHQGLSGRVRLLGSQSQSRLNQLLLQCRALVLPSVNSSETFGLVQLEAMAAGKPIIATDLPSGVAEINRPGQTGLLVPPGDADSLAQALAQCMADDDLVLRWGHQARQLFLSEYTRDQMTSKILVWYQSMTNQI